MSDTAVAAWGVSSDSVSTTAPLASDVQTESTGRGLPNQLILDARYWSQGRYNKTGRREAGDVVLGLFLVVSFWRCMKMERKDGQGKKHSPANAAVCVCISRRRCLHQQAASHCTNQSHELKRPSPGHQSPHRRRPIMARPGLLPGPRIDCRYTLCRGIQ